MIFNLTNGLVIVCSYLVGSIPFGLLITRIAGEGDIRTIGSGNIGATNVLRTGRKLLALLTLFFDFFKGWCMVFLAKEYGIESWAAVFVVLGHMFPIWLGFKGGKGVATYGGVLMALSIPLGIQAILGWIAFFVIFGYSSLAALLVSVLVPFSVWVWHYEGLLIATLILSALVGLKHIKNIQRLLKGEEPKVGPKAGKGGKAGK
jgi:glycerol-3-phosphate acyltransferase PlsY